MAILDFQSRLRNVKEVGSFVFWTLLNFEEYVNDLIFNLSCHLTTMTTTRATLFRTVGSTKP